MGKVLDDNECLELMISLADWAKSHIGRKFDVERCHPAMSRHSITRLLATLDDCGYELCPLEKSSGQNVVSYNDSDSDEDSCDRDEDAWLQDQDRINEGDGTLEDAA